MRKLKYVKLFENFQVNEVIVLERPSGTVYVSSELNSKIRQDIRHMIQETNFKSRNDLRAELFAGQNANMYQYLDKDGYLVDEVKSPYIIGYSDNGGTIVCYNMEYMLEKISKFSSIDTEEGFKEAFLSNFNSYFKKNYTNIKFK